MSPSVPPAELPAPTVAPSAPGLPESGLAAQALGTVLRPLARLMIDHGLQLPDMVELMKSALVEEAADSFGLGDKGSSDTRIALLTGVHRKDVKRLRATTSAVALTPPMDTLAASVVARWISEPRFLNTDHTARVLARTPKHSAPGEPDFGTLVAEVSTDVGSRAVLDELQRLGVVDVRADGYVALKAQAFVPREGLRESFQFLAANVADHLAAAAHNLAPARSSPPKLEQSAFSQNLSSEQAEQLAQLARSLWANALQQFLQMATVAEQRSVGAPDPTTRVRFGVYFNDTPQVTPHTQLPQGTARDRKKRKPKP